jgi:hypothetical protein
MERQAASSSRPHSQDVSQGALQGGTGPDIDQKANPEPGHQETMQTSSGRKQDEGERVKAQPIVYAAKEITSKGNEGLQGVVCRALRRAFSRR